MDLEMAIRRVVFPSLVLCVFLLPAFGQNSAAPAATNDSLHLRSLDPTYDEFPEGSLADFSFLLDAPAGKHGFAHISEKGRLDFEDGSPARFWGMVLEYPNIVVPNERVVRVLDELARAGTNMIRLREQRPNELSSSPGNESSYGGMNGITPALIERIDFWIAEAKRRGMYVSLGLSMPWGIGIGNENGPDDSLKAGPLDVFDEKRLGREKEEIRRFAVDHVNPYTGLSYSRDPAIVAFDLGESDLLSNPLLWKSNSEPGQNQLMILWNDWLRNRYRSTTRLRAAWTNASGIQALSSGESLERRTVRLPNMDPVSFDQAILAPYHDPSRSAARRSDALRFAVDMQIRYYESLKEFCEEQGIRVPVVPAPSQNWIPMTFASSRTFGAASGFLGENGPGPSEKGLAPEIAQFHWLGGPQVI